MSILRQCAVQTVGSFDHLRLPGCLSLRGTAIYRPRESRTTRPRIISDVDSDLPVNIDKEIRDVGLQKLPNSEGLP